MEKMAVLSSGGLDSAILVAELASHAIVFPIYIAMGLVWEVEEITALKDFLDALNHPNIQPLTKIEFPISSLYGNHWSTTGMGIPDWQAPDQDVDLPGRNIFLLGLTAVWCRTHQVPKIAIGSLGTNPFPDGSFEFFQNYAQVLSQGLGYQIEVIVPYNQSHKEDIISRYQHLPLELTMTCMDAQAGIHCGQCNKCYERQLAFNKAGVQDKTLYRSAIAWQNA
jgi:7-cyano-7-deazaguanine synthase